MAKLTIFFLCALFAIQVATAARVPRDAPKTEDTQKTLENALQQMQDFVKNAFSEEQLQKMGNEFKEFGEKVAAKGKELLEQADANVKKMSEKST